MKKLLIFAAIFTAGYITAAPNVSKEESKVSKTSLLQNVKNCDCLSKAISTVESKIKENPKMAILVIAAMTLVAEQVASYVYNNYLDSSEEDDDFDVA